ncbi:MAG: DNA polymerase IV [Robiginitomaculum sp.]|nr:DNA polymerase IV [Robiginitomaculum sp.]
MTSNTWCRDCVSNLTDGKTKCQNCRSVRILSHIELNQLAIAHIDCDAFFASVEKRDNPKLANKPILIGGNSPRSVVSTACYLARAFGAHSAMPMAQAKKLCPQAIIVKPRMKAYAKAGEDIRNLMLELTPLIEPLSIDEAFLDLNGTQRLHNGPPVQSLFILQNRIEKEVGIGVSIGLSHNKFLAKTASDLDKPRGFSVIGKAETLAFLAPKPPGFVYGVGASFERKLLADGFHNLSQIREMSEREMAARYGRSGIRLWRLSSGKDNRPIKTTSKRKSISTETTFERDHSDLQNLQKILWELCEKVSRLAKRKSMAGYTLTLKLKTNSHQLRTRSITLQQPVQLADTLFRELDNKLQKEIDGTRFRLIGAGLSTLVKVEEGFIEPAADLLDPSRDKRGRVERAMDKARKKFGTEAVIKGRSLPK